MNIKIPYFIFGILIGGFMFAYGGIDDSPGGQLLGLLIIIICVIGLIKSKKKIS